MRKNELLKMDKLFATSYMMRLAADDIPRIERYGYCSAYNKEVCKRGLYLRCRVQNGILKVSMFSAKYMRMGGRKPIYDLYIDKDNEEHITFDHSNGKWRTATLEHLEGYSITPQIPLGEKWISREGKKVISKYFGTEQGDYLTLVKFQNDLLDKNLIKRHKKTTDPWDEDLKQTPDLPKDWARWCSKIGIPEHYMFYNYTRNKHKTGYCTKCEKEVVIKNPKHNTHGTCPRCKTKIMYKALGRGYSVTTDTYIMYLMQRCNDGVMIRAFRGYSHYSLSRYKNPKVAVYEERRIICDPNGKPSRAYYKGNYKQREYRWIRGGICSLNWMGYADGKVYGKTIPTLKSRELKTTGLPEYIQCIKTVDPEMYLVAYTQYPYIEKIVKAGLMGFAYEFIKSSSARYEISVKNSETSLTKLLRINNMELKRLRDNNGGFRFLKWLQIENAIGTPIPDKVISWFCSQKLEYDDFKFINNRMSLEQICNYLKRQLRENEMPIRQLLITWSDYLSMAKRLGMDTNDAIVYRVRKLKQHHDELVKQCQDKSLAIRAGEILDKYPNVEKIFASIKNKYEYSDEDYTIITPTCIEDMLIEGRSLHHCVADSDRYFERINKQEAYVLFLRRTSEPTKSYYTLEIEPNGTVRQKRTMYDRQEKDIVQATAFLRKWQKVISERLTDYDKKLAHISRTMRIAEFEQLRKDQITVNTGQLAGKLLVDVLTQDLLEAA